MALSTKVGSFSMNTSTGNQSVSGLGFQPKAIIFYFNKETADGSAASFVSGMGMAVSSSSRAAIVFKGLDGADPTSGGRRHDNTSCILYCDASGNAVVDADFVSMDADGFTVNVTTADATARVVNFLALGGDDLTNVFLKEFTTPTGTGNQSQTGVGFQPEAMILMSAIFGTSPAGGAGSAVTIGSIGVATGSSNQGAMGIRPGNGVGTQINEKNQRTDKIITVTNGGSTFLEGSFVSFDSDGFTINFSTVSTARYAWALCLAGGQYHVGDDAQKTSTGTDSETGTGFTPTGLFLFSFNAAATTSLVEDTGHSIGAASAAGTESSIWWGDQDNAAVQVADEDLDRTKVIKMMTEGTPTVDAAADVSSFDSDGFTLDWTIADATARQFIYLAMGSDPVAGGAVKDIIMPGLIPFAR